MLEGLKLWIEHEQAGARDAGGDRHAAAGLITEVYFDASVSSGWIDRLSPLLNGRGEGFGLREAVIEGVLLWVERERERPRPEGFEDHFRQSLRLVCCRLLADAFMELHGVIGDDGRLVRSIPVLREGKAAAYWIGIDDLDSPVSYLNCCTVLDLDAARGRAWARPYAAALSGAGVDWEAIRRHEAILRRMREARYVHQAMSEDDGEGALYLTEQENARLKEILGDGRGAWRESMSEVAGFTRRPAAARAVAV
jgi:hypothetical protein